MRWPWSKAAEPEQRQAATGYTSQIVGALHAAAEGGTEATPIATAALEIAAGLYARCMAAAVPTGAPGADMVLTADALALIARDMIRRGESHHRILVRKGRIVLEPQGFAYAHGAGPDPMSWTYSSTAYGPTDSVHAWVRAPAMLHCRYSVDSSRPWLGVPPWTWGSTTGRAIAGLDRLVANNAGAPQGHLLGVPEAPQPAEDDESRQLDDFRADLYSAKGRTLVVERAADWHRGQGRDGPAGAGRGGFDLQSYGLAAEHWDALRTAAGRDLIAACGVPPTLFVANSDGTAQREAFRRFLHSSLRPMARLIEAEARLKLDMPGLTLDLSELWAADVAGRARAFAAFIKSGMHPDDAAYNTGVVLTRDVARPAGASPGT